MTVCSFVEDGGVEEIETGDEISLSLGGVGNSGDAEAVCAASTAFFSFCSSCSNSFNLALASRSSVYSCDLLFEFAPLRNATKVARRFAFGRDIGSGFIIL